MTSPTTREALLAVFPHEESLDEIECHWEHIEMTPRVLALQLCDMLATGEDFAAQPPLAALAKIAEDLGLPVEPSWTDGYMICVPRWHDGPQPGPWGYIWFNDKGVAYRADTTPVPWSAQETRALLLALLTARALQEVQ